MISDNLYTLVKKILQILEYFVTLFKIPSFGAYECSFVPKFRKITFFLYSKIYLVLMKDTTGKFPRFVDR